MRSWPCSEQITMLSMLLVGAAVIRERERGTIEHLLVMPIRASEIAAAKIWANGLVILVAAGLSLILVVGKFSGSDRGLDRTFPGWHGGLSLRDHFARGSACHNCEHDAAIRAAGDSGLSHSQLAVWCSVANREHAGALQVAIQISPTFHFVKFAQSVLYRAAGIDVVWRQIVLVVLGSAFLALALSRFRTMLAKSS